MRFPRKDLPIPGLQRLESQMREGGQGQLVPLGAERPHHFGRAQVYVRVEEDRRQSSLQSVRP